MKIYAKNIAPANNTSAVQRKAAESLSFFWTVSVIDVVLLLFSYKFSIVFIILQALAWACKVLFL